MHGREGRELLKLLSKLDLIQIMLVWNLKAPAPNNSVIVCGSAEETKMICLMGRQAEGGAGEEVDAVTLAPGPLLQPKIRPGK